MGSKLVTTLCYSILLLIAFGLFVDGVQIGEIDKNQIRCYYFKPGNTVQGADYRRDYGLTQKQCAESCKSDTCCMAFEWRKKLNMCTLKSRSLNGTVTTVEDDVFFGLCVDYDDSERDRFWDHEINGLSIIGPAKMDRDKCSKYCKNLADEDSMVDNKTELEIKHKSMKPYKRMAAEKSRVVIYNWHNPNTLNVDAKEGKCKCITVLHSIRCIFNLK